MNNKKVLSIVVGTLITRLVLVIGGGIFAANHYYSKLETTEPLTSEEFGVAEELVGKEEALNIVNVAVLGIDRDDDGLNGLSDAIKVISLDMNNKKMKMTSFQRDTLIYIPDPENDFNKLNHGY